MKNNKLLYTLCVIATSLFLVQGCSDDEGGTSGDSGVSFTKTASGHFEADGDGVIEIPVEASAGVEFAYDGSATLDEDYEVVGFSNGVLTLNVFDDDAAEVIEEIRIQIVSADGGVGNNNFHSVKIVSDDPGFLDIDLTWAAGEADADIDLILWLYDSTDGSFHDVDASAGATFEHVQLDWTADDGVYGLTYNLWDSDVEPVDFTVDFTPTGITLEGATDPLSFTASYTLANKDQTGNYQIEQTFVKAGTEFTDFSEIEVPAAGSRKSELISKLREAAAKRKGEMNK